MYTDTTKSNSVELKEKIKAKFGKLSDDVIDSIKGNLDLLSGKLQSAYGYAREQADKEVAILKASLHSATEPEKKPFMGIDEAKVESDQGSRKIA